MGQFENIPFSVVTVSKCRIWQTASLRLDTNPRILMAESRGFVSASPRGLFPLGFLNWQAQGLFPLQQRVRGGQPLCFVDRPELEADGGE